MERDERLAEVLGCVSLGLGVGLLSAPRLVNRLAGIRDDRTTRLWLRAVGLRELSAFALIKAGKPRAALPVWTRVGGDEIDLTLLGIAARTKLESGPRLAAATTNVVMITALDAFVALRLAGTEEAATASDDHLDPSAPDPADGAPPAGDDLQDDPAYEPPEPFKGIEGG